VAVLVILPAARPLIDHLPVRIVLSAIDHSPARRGQLPSASQMTGCPTRRNRNPGRRRSRTPSQVD
jgi:hypothetical protein